MKAALFDLDNTLYDAQQYFLGAFSDISKYISAKHNIPEQIIYKTLVKLWRKKTSMYRYLFNDLLNLFHLDWNDVGDIVKIFNEFTGRMEPYPDVIPTLRALRGEKYKLGIITDGNVERQKRKIESLKLELLLDVIIYAKEVESKPSPLSFLTALARLNVKDSDAFYVADNPLLDFKGAKGAGMKTIRVVRGEFAKVPRNEYIDFEIEKLDSFLEIAK
jgi:putative hydrolase of the HAD superfamily